jgi:saccharopine dehydrogenase-like NADP-dependent oxidoreductase
MQKTVVLFGAGKSATALINYLIEEAGTNNWRILIADTDKNLILSKTNSSPLAQAFGINVLDDEQRSALVKKADIVISLLPPSLHFLIAKDCVAFNKNLLTASYVDQPIKSLEPKIEKKGLLFLYEMGLDPGIDHMSAMQMIDSIHEKGGHIISFKSHCGGLIAPESDNNPWHYKISWNPKNIVMAGKAGATYKLDNLIVQEKYEELFDAKRGVDVPGLGFLSFYPNRDSLNYIDLYQLQEAATFIRTTLRYPDFMIGWKNLIDLKLTDDIKEYETDGLLLSDFFKQHLESQSVNEKHEANLIVKQLVYLGMHDDKTLINKGVCHASDVLQFAMETKLALQPGDKDMVVMLHELRFNEAGKIYNRQSHMIVKGDNEINTAMAKTVGLPLGIAVKLILNNTITLKGLQIPVKKEIYEPVLIELKKYGINFIEEVVPIL